MHFRWLPWRWLLKFAARRYDIIDPVSFLARLRRFSQPSEVQEPIELLRAGIVFHARGLINTKAIQHNLDWVWPYWVEKQFNPRDPSFIPRGFSFSHVNLTHRNWTAVGQPHIPLYPIIDPHGLVTPHHDGWSLDFLIISPAGSLYPSRLQTVEQHLDMQVNPAVVTRCRKEGMTLTSRVEMTGSDSLPAVNIALTAFAAEPARLAVAIRPYNPEGIQFIEQIELHRPAVIGINRDSSVCISDPIEQFYVSNYENGDVLNRLTGSGIDRRIECQTGMASAAALFQLFPGERKELVVTVPLAEELRQTVHDEFAKIWPGWSATLAGSAALQIPDRNMNQLYDAAVRTLVLLSARETVPGPYTYRRFWFRDACLMMQALLALNMPDRCRRSLDMFPAYQKMNGYFQSQEGEWDSNGQVLWMYGRYYECTGEKPAAKWLAAVRRGVKWLAGKRLKKSKDVLIRGLLPAGFSAEHFGPNDFYYWDDFWAVAGFQAAGALLGKFGTESETSQSLAEADDMLKSIYDSIKAVPEDRRRGGLPASPHRRLDAGAIGSMVADYPLRLTPPNDPAIMRTADFLIENCFLHGGFFQDIIHSGINAYLTLAIGQTLLRSGDERYRHMLHAVADMASPTGQWPEAIHPQTGGGCMGDGQHGWAAAEWVMMIRNMFVREEEDRLIIGSGILPQWLEAGKEITFGPTLTPWGKVAVSLSPAENEVNLKLSAWWRKHPRAIEIALPGYDRQDITEWRDTYSLTMVKL